MYIYVKLWILLGIPVLVQGLWLSNSQSTILGDACIVILHIVVLERTIFKHFSYKFLYETLNPSWDPSSVSRVIVLII